MAKIAASARIARIAGKLFSQSSGTKAIAQAAVTKRSNAVGLRVRSARKPQSGGTKTVRAGVTARVAAIWTPEKPRERR